MEKVTSKDGTTIMFERSGKGPAVVLVGGILGDHSQQAPLAGILAEHFTVFNYDRRGHGQSDETPPYVEIYVHGFRIAQGEVRDARTFTIPIPQGAHEVEIRLVNTHTRNGVQRRVRLS